LNIVVIAAFANTMECTLNIDTGDTFEVRVTATDFLGGSHTLTHTVTRLNVEMPNVYFFPAGVKTLGTGEQIVFPNTQ